MRSHDEHWLYGLRESARQRTTHCVQFPFITSHKESQASRFYALSSSSPACVPRLELLFSLVVRSLSPSVLFFSYFLISADLPCLGSKRLSNLFNGQNPHHQRSFAFSSLPTIEPSGKDMEYSFTLRQ